MNCILSLCTLLIYTSTSEWNSSTHRLNCVPGVPGPSALSGSLSWESVLSGRFEVRDKGKLFGKDTTQVDIKDTRNWGANNKQKSPKRDTEVGVEDVD